MSRLFQSVDFNSMSSCSSDSDNETSSEDDETEERTISSQTQSDDGLNATKKSMKSQNILLKLNNRERTGFFSDSISHKDKKMAFMRVPKRLNFCLKEIVPYCYLNGHIFMGLTICGQFLLSYKIISDEDSTENNYSFTSTYKYELYFWIYRPHNLLCKYYMVCLFDDHGVDNIKTVTMSQWKSNPRILIVHGAGGYENEDSYVTIVAVPNLCCRDCKQMRDDYYSDSFDLNRCGFLCIKCNLTIHTKYCRAESDPAFNPFVSLQCIDKILIVANGLFHIVHVDLDLNRPIKPFAKSIDIKYVQNRETYQEYVDSSNPTEELGRSWMSASVPFKNPVESADKMNKEKTAKALAAESIAPAAATKIIETKNIVDTIIADFAECETDPVPNEKYLPSNSSGSHFDELVITCGGDGGGGSSGGSSNIVGPAPMPSNSCTSSNRVRLLNHRSNRIISKNLGAMKNGITKIELNPMHSIPGGVSAGASATSSNGANKNLDKAAKAYEFSEDNEKCEKISTFRKRRLADKKYEFCEDNTENIIPYTKMRSVIRNPVLHQKFSKQSPVHTGYFSSASPPSSFDSMSITTSHHTHRASPSYGFRSPCGSPVGNRFMMMSPPARSCFSMRSPSCTRAATMSPRSQPSMKRPYYDTLLENSLILSPRSDDCDNNLGKPCVQPLSEVKPSNIEVRSNQLNATENKNAGDTDKPMCSIKLIRRYVEEDDAASVITSEEDDCISPGYHTSLPLEVHGAGYSDMQMVSKMSYKKLLCPTVTVTQTTFDLEAFTYYAVNYLCSINNRKYGFFFDCACEIVKMCPLSCVLTCILMAHFTASDLQPDSNIKNCTNCSSSLNLDCAFHRKHYECQILFTWDIDTGEWNVLDYGSMTEVPASLANGKNTSYIHRIVSKLAADMISGLNAYSEIFNNLHVLDSCVDKSKKILTDFENSIAFYRTSQHRYSFSDASDID